jgi:integrase
VGERIYRDVELPGFTLRVTPARKAFVVEKRFKGRLWKVTLGAYGPMTLDQAREMGRKRLFQILNGEDPSQEKKALTFGQFADLYLERYARPRKKSVRNDIAMLSYHLAQWRARKLGSLTRQEIASLHSRIGTVHPYQANRLLALVRRMFNLAKTWGLYQGDNPATGIDRFKEHKRDRFILPQELPHVLEAVQAESNIYIRTAFVVCLLTGARKQEVLTMKWEDLQLKEATWRIPDTKADRPHLVPLPTALVPLLREIPRHLDNPYVFPSRNGQGHLVNLSKAWKRICARADLPELRIHDLRRTLGSWLAASGASLTLIGKVLNHSQIATTQIYARLDLDPVRTALNENAKKMLPLGFGA